MSAFSLGDPINRSGYPACDLIMMVALAERLEAVAQARLARSGNVFEPNGQRAG